MNGYTVQSLYIRFTITSTEADLCLMSFYTYIHKCKEMMRWKSRTTEFLVTIATNCRVLARFIDASYETINLVGRSFQFTNGLEVFCFIVLCVLSEY
jgi:hypothetical protein